MDTLAIIKKHRELSMAFTYLLRRGLNHTVPYHNFQHSLMVMQRCFLASRYYKFLSERERDLLIAALFHDANHSAGAAPDSENVASAVLFYQNFVAFCRLEGILGDEMIIGTIQATEYPYTKDVEEIHLEGKIIRDADLMSPFSEDWIQTDILGKAKESNKGLPEQITAQVKLLENLEFQTDWAQEIRDELWFKVQSNMQDFKEIFNQPLQ